MISPSCHLPHSASQGHLKFTQRGVPKQILRFQDSKSPASPSEKVFLKADTRAMAKGDGVVIVDHGSRRSQSNAMLHEFVKMYKEETGQQVVEAAHMELADPTISNAFDRCVEQGATRIIISPYFLFPGRHWDRDIPALVADAAKRHPGVAYVVTAPIGLHKMMVTVMEERMHYCLSRVDGKVEECEMCRGSGRCKEMTSGELNSSSDVLAGVPVDGLVNSS